MLGKVSRNLDCWFVDSGDHLSGIIEKERRVDSDQGCWDQTEGREG